MRPRMLRLRNNAESRSNHSSIFRDLAGHYRRGPGRHKMPAEGAATTSRRDRRDDADRRRKLALRPRVRSEVVRPRRGQFG